VIGDDAEQPIVGARTDRVAAHGHMLGDQGVDDGSHFGCGQQIGDTHAVADVDGDTAAIGRLGHAVEGGGGSAKGRGHVGRA
jgi:hypothetical protein